MNADPNRKRRKSKNPVERFWKFVDKSGDCWIWTGTKSCGYGMFWDGESHVRATRFVYRITKGPLEPGKVIMHSCDNPACVNPSHLTQGTYQENLLDASRKGRLNPPTGDRHWSRRKPAIVARGESHSMAKLSTSQVIEILSSYTGKRGERTALAKKYGVTPVHIGVILRGESRKAESQKFFDISTES